MTVVGAPGFAQSNHPSVAAVLSTMPIADTIAAAMVQKADRLAAFAEALAVAAAFADSTTDASSVSASRLSSAASFEFLKIHSDMASPFLGLILA